jgi:formylglycine-generating enzyme required for sulfatase activity
MELFVIAWPGAYRGGLACCGCSPVDALPATDKGFHDVFGSAWEWCEDHFSALPGTKAMHRVDDDQLIEPVLWSSSSPESTASRLELSYLNHRLPPGFNPQAHLVVVIQGSASTRCTRTSACRASTASTTSSWAAPSPPRATRPAASRAFTSDPTSSSTLASGLLSPMPRYARILVFRPRLVTSSGG